MRYVVFVMAAFLLAAAAPARGQTPPVAGSEPPRAQSTPPASPAPEPASASPPSPPPRVIVLTPEAVAAKAESARIYAEPPVISACKAGKLTDDEKGKVLDLVNRIRRRHGLTAVRYEPDWDASVMGASLVMAANGLLEHEIGPNWLCYSPAAGDGALNANIYGGVVSAYIAPVSSEDMVISWLTDTQNMTEGDIGHRRWLLDPFMTRIAFGRVLAVLDDGRITEGAALRVVNDDAPPTIEMDQEVLAYPFGDYPMAWYHPDARLSFGVLINPADRWANVLVDYSRASIAVTAEDGTVMTVTDQQSDPRVYGLGNSLLFQVEGLKPGVKYQVMVREVIVGGRSRDYDYGFRLTP